MKKLVVSLLMGFILLACTVQATPTPTLEPTPKPTPRPTLSLEERREKVRSSLEQSQMKRENERNNELRSECREFQSSIREAQRLGASNEEIVVVLLRSGLTIAEIKTMAVTCAIELEVR